LPGLVGDRVKLASLALQLAGRRWRRSSCWSQRQPRPHAQAMTDALEQCIDQVKQRLMARQQRLQQH